MLDVGLVDLGPLVGLWYAAVSVQALRVRRVAAVLTYLNST